MGTSIKYLILLIALGTIIFLINVHVVETKHLKSLVKKGRVKMTIYACQEQRKRISFDYFLGEVCSNPDCSALDFLQTASNRSRVPFLTLAADGKDVESLMGCKNSNEKKWRFLVNGVDIKIAPFVYRLIQGDNIEWYFN